MFIVATHNSRCMDLPVPTGEPYQVDTMRAACAVVFCLPLVVAGCSFSPTAAPSPDAGLALQGVVHGGQQPINGAHVYMFAANTTGNAGPGIAASTSNASLSLQSHKPPVISLR